MFKTIPPAGIPYKWSFVFNPEKTGSSSFESSLSGLFGGKTYLTNSGRSALYLILKAAQKLRPERHEVIIPDYTCWSVPSAIVKAGLKARPVDIDPDNFGLSPDAVDTAIGENTLAVVHAHLFGIPGAIDKVEKICQKRNIFLIDDSAQGLGARLGGRLLGSFGDAGVFSFGRGKTITTLHGGAAVIRNEELAQAAGMIFRDEFPKPGAGDISAILQLSAYKALFNRRLYWIPDSLPFIKIGETVFAPDFPVSRMADSLAARGESMLKNMEDIIAVRNSNAALYQDMLKNTPNINMPKYPSEAQPAFIRMPILLTDWKKRRIIIKKGHNRGISAMYPGTVGSIRAIESYLAKNIEDCPIAKRISETLVTLPIHHGINNVDIDNIIYFLKSVI